MLTFAVPDALEPRVEKTSAIGDSGASFRTPAGWTLIAATAQLRTTNATMPAEVAEPAATPATASFVLAGTCPARTVENLFVRPASAAPPKVKRVPQAVAPAIRTTADEAAAIAAEPPSPSAYGLANAATNLPSTGLDITGMLTLGVTLVVAGVVLLIVRRQRDKPVAQAEPSDWY